MDILRTEFIPRSRCRCSGAIAWLVAALLAWLPLAASAAQDLTRSEAEATLARLSDQEVRDLLLRQLARADDQPGAEQGFNPAVIMYRLQRDVGQLSEQLHGIFGALTELPQMFPRAWASFAADREQGGIVRFVIAVLVSMGVGLVVAALLRLRVRAALGPVDPHRELTTRAKVGTLLTRFLVHGVYVAVYSAVAAAVYIVAFDAGPKDRIAFFFYLAASAIFMLSIAASLAVHAPRYPSLRVPLYEDRDAKALHRAALVAVGFGAFAFFTCALFGTLGVVGEVHELFLILVGAATTALLIRAILSGRLAITRDIASDALPGSSRASFARLWPLAFASIVGVMFVALVIRELLYDFVPYGAALFTIGLLAVAPSLDAVLYREARRSADEGTVVIGAMARAGRLVLLVLLALAMSAAWRINPFAGGTGGIGAEIASMAIQVTLTVLVGYAAWQVTRIVIDQKIAKEDAELAAQGIDMSENEIGGGGLSRMRTLLPLAKRTAQIALFVMVTMVALASLGVDIAPLLAGAGVIGLAIGFGSQTLVRDIVSGAFFLLDDAFRIGEYIDVGGVMGTVEKMSVRSVRLRHHRGAVHTVPFGEVKTLTNFSRDWAIMKLKFRVPFDTDVDKVRKLLKKTGQELALHEDIKDDFIQPFKSQGVTEADDYGFIISTKFMSKPGRQFLIRRYAFAAVQKAFEANGISFATPKVEVTVEEGEDDAGPADGSRRSRAESQAIAAAGHTIASARPAAAD